MDNATVIPVRDIRIPAVCSRGLTNCAGCVYSQGYAGTVDRGYVVCKDEEPPDPYAKLKKAMKDGKTLQLRNYIGVWCDWDSRDAPNFDCPVDDYRIKPKPKYIPWAVKTCPWDKLKGAWLTCGLEKLFVTGLDRSYNGHVRLGSTWYTFEELFHRFTFEDRTPCGQEVEE